MYSIKIMSITDLSGRWTDALIEKTNQLKQNPDHSTSLENSPFESTDDGRTDYRHWVAKQVLQRARIANADFSDMRCEWAGAFNDCAVDNCVFDRAKIEGRYISKAFSNCSFVQAMLRQASLVGRFVNCDFSLANLNRAGARDVHFIDCNFTGADFRRAMFTHCTMDNCIFDNAKFHNGSFASTRFFKASPDPVALGNTVMDHVKL